MTMGRVGTPIVWVGPAVCIVRAVWCTANREKCGLVGAALVRAILVRQLDKRGLIDRFN